MLPPENLSFEWKTIADGITGERLLSSLHSNEHDFVEWKPLKQKGDSDPGLAARFAEMKAIRLCRCQLKAVFEPAFLTSRNAGSKLTDVVERCRALSFVRPDRHITVRLRT